MSDVLGIDSTRYARAWQAWQGTEFKHGPGEPLPDVPVLLWFDHWGRYSGGYGQYGHVALNVPGVGIYTSPSTPLGSPASYEIYSSIREIERRFNSTYVGWSEDLAGHRIAAPATTVRKDTRMHAVRQIGLPDSGIIIGAGQAPRARHESVFIAECNALGITPVDVPDWQYGTVVREAWTDFSTTAGIIADAVAGKLPKGAPTAPLGISDADAQRIAEAVANEHAERLKK